MDFAAGETKQLNVPLKPITGPGSHWVDLGRVASETIFTMGVPLHDGAVVAGCFYAVASRSINYGATWSDMGVVAEDIICGIAYPGNSIIIMGDASGNIFRSTDKGAHWSKVTEFTGDAIECGTQLENGHILLGSYRGWIYRSTDQGLHWTQVNYGATAAVTQIADLGNGVVLMYSLNRYIYRSTDYGVTWTRRGSVYQLHAMALMDPGMAIIEDFSTGNVFVSQDYGLNWQTAGRLPYNHIRCFCYLGDGIVMAGGDNQRIYRSMDYGAKWTDLYGRKYTSNFIYAMAYLGNNTAVIGDRGGHVYRSTW